MPQVFCLLSIAEFKFVRIALEKKKYTQMEIS